MCFFSKILLQGQHRDKKDTSWRINQNLGVDCPRNQNILGMLKTSFEDQKYIKVGTIYCPIIRHRDTGQWEKLQMSGGQKKWHKNQARTQTTMAAVTHSIGPGVNDKNNHVDYYPNKLYAGQRKRPMTLGDFMQPSKQ